MISYILKEATKSKLFDKIHVSTNSGIIESIVNELGYEIDFLRPDSLSDDKTPLQPVLQYVLEKYAKLGMFFDEAWLLLPCSPLIESNDLIGASQYLDLANISKSGFIAVVEFPTPIEWAYDINSDGLLNPLDSSKLKIRSQDLEKKYYDSGTFMSFIIDNKTDKKRPKLNDNSFLGYKISKLKGIDIDTEEDWELAEYVYTAIKNKRSS